MQYLSSMHAACMTGNIKNCLLFLTIPLQKFQPDSHPIPVMTEKKSMTLWIP